MSPTVRQNKERAGKGVTSAHEYAGQGFGPRPHESVAVLRSPRPKGRFIGMANFGIYEGVVKVNGSARSYQ
jgi:hypothetical protein